MENAKWSKATGEPLNDAAREQDELPEPAATLTRTYSASWVRQEIVRAIGAMDEGDTEGADAILNDLCDRILTIDYCRVADAAPDMLRILKCAVLRIELENANGNNILSAWLPGARAAIAEAQP